jgi:hypothetical protein
LVIGNPRNRQFSPHLSRFPNYNLPMRRGHVPPPFREVPI